MAITSKTNIKDEIILVFDKECPVCSYYCRMVRIKESVGELKLLNARETSAVIDEITEKGLDIDQGMVLKMGTQYYDGPDAVHALALISSRLGLFNRFNYWIFRSKILSALLYPTLRFFRNLLLKILLKTKINNLDHPNNPKF